MSQVFKKVVVFALALHCCTTGMVIAAEVPKRDVTFFLISDPHVGSENVKATPPVTREQTSMGVQSNLAALLKTVGEPYPTTGVFNGMNLGTVATPRGLLIAGDLTDNLDWERFTSIFPASGVGTDSKKIPVFLCLGNHDGDAKGATRKEVVKWNRAYREDKKLAAVSDNGLHYALNWEGVHILSLNLCPADTVDKETIFKFGAPGEGSWNDPDQALSFMKNYLRDHVGKSGEPVLLMQHYGFDGFSMNDWNWWTPKQRRALYDAIKPYNVVAFLHGHDHAPNHYRWPDAKANPDEVKRLFGESAPSDLKSYDVFSTGRAGWVFRILDDKLIASHRKDKSWNASLKCVLPLCAKP
jgi:cytolysin (calcineurin-like family phosphatase)